MTLIIVVLFSVICDDTGAIYSDFSASLLQWEIESSGAWEAFSPAGSAQIDAAIAAGRAMFE